MTGVPLDSGIKRVLVLATTTGYQIRSFGDAAKALGVRLVFASDRCDQLTDPWWDQAIAVRFREPRQEAIALTTALGARGVDGLIAVGDRPTVLAAHVADILDLPGHPPASAEASRNKLATREAFRRGGLLTPRFREIAVESDLREVAQWVGYPAVLKPFALSGSRGVMRVDSAEALGAAVSRLRQLLQAPDVRAERDGIHQRMLVESFIPGRECAVEAVLTNGALQVLAVFDKPDPLDGPFFEETIYATPSRESTSVQADIADTVAKAAGALGLRHGAIHAECRLNEDGVWMLEVAARPIGGLCSRVLRFERQPSDGTLHSLEDLLLRHATGEDVSAYRREAVAAAVMMIPIPVSGIYKGVEGVDEARAIVGVEDIVMTAKPDGLLAPLPEGRSYLGFIFARGATPADAERAVRDAHARLRFSIQRNVAVVKS